MTQPKPLWNFRQNKRHLRHIATFGMLRYYPSPPSGCSISHSETFGVSDLSEGFPHFIHQYGFCAFDLSDGKTITVENVQKGAFGENGAIEKIGDRYYRDDYYNKIKVESYRQVLTIMAEKLDDWVSKKYIKSRFKGTDSTLNNAIKALRSRDIILSKEGSSGTYRLQDKGFAWWIKMNQEKEIKAA